MFEDAIILPPEENSTSIRACSKGNSQPEELTIQENDFDLHHPSTLAANNMMDSEINSLVQLQHYSTKAVESNLYICASPFFYRHGQKKPLKLF